MFGRYVKAKFLASVIEFAFMNSKDAPFGLEPYSYWLDWRRALSPQTRLTQLSIINDKVIANPGGGSVVNVLFSPPLPHQPAPFHS